jgi:signal transduction histidine kinase
MKSLIVYPKADVTPGYRPFQHSNSDIRSANTNNLSWTASENNDYPGPFIIALIHELRNPLTNIKLSVELLESAATDDKWQIFLDIIKRSTTRINDLVNDLLKSRQDAVQAERHSIHQLLDEVLELAKDRISLKNIVVIKKYDQNCELSLNRPEMKIALTNIIGNAIEAMTAGKGQLKIVTKSINGKYVLIIQDNGCGISKENLKNIFKPYFTNKPGGLGLGLTATYNLLRKNDIRVNVESREGKGTYFILLFDSNENSKNKNNNSEKLLPI